MFVLNIKNTEHQQFSCFLPNSPWNDSDDFMFVAVSYQQRTTWKLEDYSWFKRTSTSTYLSHPVFAGRKEFKIYFRITKRNFIFLLAWHESVFCLIPPAQSFHKIWQKLLIMKIKKKRREFTMFGVILDARYFMPLHWSSVKTGTLTCCSIPGSDPPSEVLPHPTTVPVFPEGSIDSRGRQIGWMPFANVTGLRSRSKAMSWL